jgi:hypothetical protein
MEFDHYDVVPEERAKAILGIISVNLSSEPRPRGPRTGLGA